MDDSNKASIQRIDSYLSYQDQFDPTGFIDGIIDADSARDAVDSIDQLEDMLNAAKKFGEYASKFCLLECQVWIKISKTEGADKKLSKGKKLVEWLRGKNDDELREIVDKCSCGTRIGVVRSREIGRNRSERELTELKRISDKIFSEAEQCGVVRNPISRYYEEWSMQGKPDPRDVRTFQERTHQKLLSDGFLGLGDGSGEFLRVESCDRHDIEKIVANRLRRIMADVTNLCKICNDSGFRVRGDGIKNIKDTLTKIEAT